MSLQQRLVGLIGKKVTLKLNENESLSPSGLAGYLQHQKGRLSLLKEIETNWNLKDTALVQPKLKLAFPDYTLVEINQNLDLDGLRFVIRTTESFLANHIQRLGAVQGTILSVSSTGVSILLLTGEVRHINFDLVQIQIQ